MPQMSPILWMFLLLLMLFTYLSIMSSLNSHSCSLPHVKNVCISKSSMEW